MHAGSVAIFDEPAGGFDYDALVGLVEDRIALVPRYRQKVRPVLGRLVRPVWGGDPDFDLTYHVRRSGLPQPGTQEELRGIAERKLPDLNTPDVEAAMRTIADNAVELAQGGLGVLAGALADRLCFRFRCCQLRVNLGEAGVDRLGTFSSHRGFYVRQFGVERVAFRLRLSQQTMIFGQVVVTEQQRRVQRRSTGAA